MLYHESHGAGVDVGVMDAAVFSVGVLPVGGTFVLLTEASGFSWICDGPDGEHTNSLSVILSHGPASAHVYTAGTTPPLKQLNIKK